MNLLPLVAGEKPPPRGALQDDAAQQLDATRGERGIDMGDLHQGGDRAADPG